MIVSKVYMMMLNRTNSVGENTKSRHVNSHDMTNNRYISKPDFREMQNSIFKYLH